MDKKIVEEKRRLEEKLNRLGSIYVQESLAVCMLRHKLLEKQSEFFAEAVSDAKDTRVTSLAEKELQVAEIYEKFIEKTPYLTSLFPKIVSQGALIRLVAGFEYFVMNSVKAVLETYSDLVNDKFRGSDNFVEAQLTRLRENSLQKKLDFIAGRLGISLDAQDFNGKKLAEIIATRHIITHNAGMVDDKYLKDIGPNTPFRSGEERPIDDAYFLDSAGVLNSAVFYLSLKLTEEYCGTVWDD